MVLGENYDKRTYGTPVTQMKKQRNKQTKKILEDQRNKQRSSLKTRETNKQRRSLKTRETNKEDP